VAETPPAAPVEAPPAPAEAAPEGNVEEIVVTGSAIRRKDLVTPAPLTVMDHVDLEATGRVSLGEILQSLPVQADAINVQVNNGSTGDGSTRINLRGLGSNRTLVLLNGRRFVFGGGGADASVDLNAIPVDIIERIEVLKDGASAIYGSDAISGVVNVITRRRFQGTEATVYTGTSTHLDATMYDLSVSTGVASKKGGVMFSAGFYKQEDIFSGAREWAKFPLTYRWTGAMAGTYGPTGSGATPQGAIYDLGDDDCTMSTELFCEQGNALWQAYAAQYAATGETMTLDYSGGAQGYGGVQTGSPKTGQYSGGVTNPGTAWRPFNFGGTSDTGTGDRFNYAPTNYLVTPAQRYNVFAQGDYDLHENIRGYFEALYNNRQSAQLLASEPVFWGGTCTALDTAGNCLEYGVVSADNVYNPFGRSFYDMARRITETGGRRFTEDFDTFRTVLGIDGTIPGTDKTWNYDVSFNFGRSSSIGTVEGEMLISKLKLGLGPSYKDDTGYHCGTPDAPIQGCVPVDFFDGAGSITPEMLNYISYTGVSRGDNEQKIASVTASGKLFDIPDVGGPVSLAVGGVFDREDGKYTPDPVTASGDSVDGLVVATGGGYQVWSGYAELNATLLQNMTGADKVELVGAIRGGSYDTFGSFVTWKGGLRWQLLKDIAVRGTASTAFRAPNIPDLYAGQVDSFPTVFDPCDTSGANGPISATAAAQCAREGVPTNFTDTAIQLKERLGGNPDLEPETAKTYTAGIVFTPTFFKGFSLALDYYNIDIENAITAEGADIILNNCYQTDNPDPAECAKVVRDPISHKVQFISDLNTNIGGESTSGVDFDVAYRFRVNPIGNLRLNLFGTYLMAHDAVVAGGRKIEGAGVYDLGLNPRIRFNFATQWAKEGWGAGFNVRFVGAFTECQGGDCSEIDNPDPDMKAPTHDIPSYATLDLHASKDFDWAVGKTTIAIGAQNVLDQDPPYVFTGAGTLTVSDATNYDYLGRYFYLRLTQGF
jgi:outer membrane receptor protein involved in Fe transport